MDSGALPEGWMVWDHQEHDSLILAFRPDEFDGERFPPQCLPTIYVREGVKDLRQAGPQPAPGSEDTYTVRLFLEPEVVSEVQVCDTWEDAMDTALTVADAFATGEFDIRGLYQLPREAYLDHIEELIAAHDR